MKSRLLSFAFTILSLSAIGQGIVVDSLGVAVNENEISADPSAILDISSDSRGLLIPRVTTAEMEAIQNPADGLIVYNSTGHVFMYYDGSSWKDIIIADSISGNEEDPVFSASEASSINASNTLNWNTAYSWGDHSRAGYLTNGDNFGNHTATANVKLNGNYLSNDGGNEGLFIDNLGVIKTTNDVYIGDDVRDLSSDLYISSRIIDWDNPTFMIKPGSTSIMKNIDIDDGGRVGLGSSMGRIVFDDAAYDELEIYDANIVVNASGVTPVYSSAGIMPGATPKLELNVDGGAGGLLCMRNTGGTNPVLGLLFKLGSESTAQTFPEGEYAYQQMGGIIFESTSSSNQNGSLHLVTYDQKRLSILKDGSVGIGTTSPSYKLEIQGTFKVSSSSYMGNIYPSASYKYLGNSSNRWYRIYSEDGVVHSSDLRLKENIVNIEAGLDKINQLRPVNYTWKSDSTSSLRSGLIAQEVESVLPHIVEPPELIDGEMSYYGLVYTEFIPYLIKAAQELDDENQELKAELEQLRTTVEALQTAVEELQENN